MNNKHQENGALTGPLIFTLPASSFVVILSLDWLDGTVRAAVSAKTHSRNYLAYVYRFSIPPRHESAG